MDLSNEIWHTYVLPKPQNRQVSKFNTGSAAGKYNYWHYILHTWFVQFQHAVPYKSNSSS